MVIRELRLLVLCDSTNPYTSESFPSLPPGRWRKKASRSLKWEQPLDPTGREQECQQRLLTAEENNFGGQLARHLLYNDIKKNISLNVRSNALRDGFQGKKKRVPNHFLPKNKQGYKYNYRDTKL